MSDEPQAQLRRLREALDLVVVGHQAAKTGLLLGLLARLHVFLEGPPGCAKSLLAQSMVDLTGAPSATFVFHRDIKSEDILGDPLLRRTRLGSEVERIRVDVDPGPLFLAELILLEDLPRAPGEALGVLLRVLSERRALGRKLALEMAIATAPCDSPDGRSDPLEPTQLDRFAIQVRLEGLVAGQRRESSRELLDRSVDAPRRPAALEPVLDESSRRRLQAMASSMPVPAPVRERHLQLLDELRAGAGPRDLALLSDRAFALNATHLMRAHAVLRGAEETGVGDLAVLRLMVARRFSAQLTERLETLLADPAEEPAPSLQVPAAGGSAEGRQAVLVETAAHRPRPGAVPSSARVEDGVAAVIDADRLVAKVERLMRALAGRIERGSRDPDSDPGGQPRSYRPLRRLDDLLDADLVDAVLLIEGRLPGSARAFRRKRRAAGGALVVLRDISASMAGPKSAWAAQIVRGVIRAAARKRVRVGYVEFDHRARAYPVAGRFLHRSYAMLASLAESQRAIGQTNYEAPLRLALGELRGRTGRNRHLVMLTDGLPILGDPQVRRERALAARLGVHLHTVYLGEGECPAVLDELSRETGGLRFRALSVNGAPVDLEERA